MNFVTMPKRQQLFEFRIKHSEYLGNNWRQAEVRIPTPSALPKPPLRIFLHPHSVDQNQLILLKRGQAVPLKDFFSHSHQEEHILFNHLRFRVLSSSTTSHVPHGELDHPA
jgi:hypothetical protein